MMTTEILECVEPACIIYERAKILDQLRTLNGLVKVARDAEAAAAGIEGVRITACNVWSEQIDILIHNDDPFGSAVKVLRALASMGYHGTAFRDAPDMTQRIYSRGPIEVTAYLGTSGKCRRVQTGTKEVPVYEIQCGESEEPL